MPSVQFEIWTLTFRSLPCRARWRSSISYSSLICPLPKNRIFTVILFGVNVIPQNMHIKTNCFASTSKNQKIMPFQESAVYLHNYWYINGRDPVASAGIFKQSMGARNRVGIGLSYQPARLHSVAELVSWNRFLSSLKVEKFGLCTMGRGAFSIGS
jgi:hypothetical protein